MTRVGLLLLALLCTACQASWPREGYGGMAERSWPTEKAAAGAPYGLRARMVCTLGRLEALHDASSRTGVASGELGLLEITAIRAKREYAGLLYRDSAVTLAQLDLGIDDVHKDIAPLPQIPGDCA